MGKQRVLPKDMERYQSRKENESIAIGFWVFPKFRPFSLQQQQQISSSEMSKLQGRQTQPKRSSLFDTPCRDTKLLNAYEMR